MSTRYSSCHQKLDVCILQRDYPSWCKYYVYRQTGYMLSNSPWLLHLHLSFGLAIIHSWYCQLFYGRGFYTNRIHLSTIDNYCLGSLFARQGREIRLVRGNYLAFRLIGRWGLNEFILLCTLKCWNALANHRPFCTRSSLFLED